jgi:hypothetical protein
LKSHFEIDNFPANLIHITQNILIILINMFTFRK